MLSIQYSTDNIFLILKGYLSPQCLKGRIPELRARIRARIPARIRARIPARIPARIRAKMSFLRCLFSNLSVRLGLESVRLGLYRLVLV